jgi:hypothetical protein
MNAEVFTVSSEVMAVSSSSRRYEMPVNRNVPNNCTHCGKNRTRCRVIFRHAFTYICGGRAHCALEIFGTTQAMLSNMAGSNNQIKKVATFRGS